MALALAWPLFKPYRDLSIAQFNLHWPSIANLKRNNGQVSRVLLLVYLCGQLTHFFRVSSIEGSRLSALTLEAAILTHSGPLVAEPSKGIAWID
mgnify:CR=1 FL=1